MSSSLARRVGEGLSASVQPGSVRPLANRMQLASQMALTYRADRDSKRCGKSCGVDQSVSLGRRDCAPRPVTHYE